MRSPIPAIVLTALAAVGGVTLSLTPSRGSGPSALVATAPEAGVIAIAGPVPGRIRVLYARNGGMVLLREITLPAAATVRELALSADGSDLFVATDAVAYAVSTRTGRVEAQVLAAGKPGHAARARKRAA